MQAVLDAISGKKTYIALGAGIIAVALNHFGLWPASIPLGLDPANWITDEWKLLVALFGRAAVAKI